MNLLKNIKGSIHREINELRTIIGSDPDVMLWRLRVFHYSPLLSKHFFKILGIFIILLTFFTSFYFFSWRSPRPFPSQTLISVEKGESLTNIADSFEEKGVIRSSFWLKVFIVLLGGEKRVIAGDYYFESPKNIFSIADALHKGKFGLIAIKVTIPEGLSSFEIAPILEKSLPAFNGKDFVKEVVDNNYEGYLFPDTYFFMPNTRSSEVITSMRENFARQVEQFKPDVEKFKKPLDEIIIMASIIEDEAGKGIATKRTIAGILWKRIRLKMPLQVDAPFKYYNGKNSYTLTKSDLKDDNPYNTYTNKGLPPTAITNQGLDSIRAAMTPTNTEYLYFLSDKSGNTYYAKDFAGHQNNRELYLR